MNPNSKITLVVSGHIMYEGIVKVSRYHHDPCRDGIEEYNFIGPDGKLICDQWWDSCSQFYSGVATVCRNGKWNIVNNKGELLSPKLWFDGIIDFENKQWTRVKIKEKGFNYLNNKGELLSPALWFDSAWDFNPNGQASVWFNKKTCIIDTTGNIIIVTDFDHVEPFVDGFARVCKRIKGEFKWNLIDINGNLVSSDWFGHVGMFTNGFCKVTDDRLKQNYIDKNGQILSPYYWFDRVDDFENYGLALVYVSDRGYNCINTQGSLVWPKWSKSF